MRVTTAFKRLLDLAGVIVTDVAFETAKVVVTVKLGAKKLQCPECSFSTRARYDSRSVASVWRHLDLGHWRLEVRSVLRRLTCPTHGVRTEAVPFARAGSRFTRDFEDLVAGWQPAWTRARCVGWSGSTGTPWGASSNASWLTVWTPSG